MAGVIYGLEFLPGLALPMCFSAALTRMSLNLDVASLTSSLLVMLAMSASVSSIQHFQSALPSFHFGIQFVANLCWTAVCTSTRMGEWSDPPISSRTRQVVLFAHIWPHKLTSGVLWLPLPLFT